MGSGGTIIGNHVDISTSVTYKEMMCSPTDEKKLLRKRYLRVASKVWPSLDKCSRMESDLHNVSQMPELSKRIDAGWGSMAAHFSYSPSHGSLSKIRVAERTFPGKRPMLVDIPCSRVSSGTASDTDGTCHILPTRGAAMQNKNSKIRFRVSGQEDQLTTVLVEEDANGPRQ
ncbi:uncharacterized protein BO80DRAFT_430609 [Aspergillus ibericus CBS 121593]|uniref:Uncharacterized protein n=1 Tax=Aspergillus ibericus CBS 121593 TaxID=1448316 RepID=A0A395HEF4_9EURO|nr:hypothetical protein BO80DRAFT_430609 [Aspergillus ibericus CBS 121593]RAL06242.1 hypothetical protein BO80DRAFT_430609 [Aspergillus ibericus CBS 121593]